MPWRKKNTCDLKRRLKLLLLLAIFLVGLSAISLRNHQANDVVYSAVAHFIDDVNEAQRRNVERSEQSDLSQPDIINNVTEEEPVILNSGYFLNTGLHGKVVSSPYKIFPNFSEYTTSGNRFTKPSHDYTKLVNGHTTLGHENKEPNQRSLPDLRHELKRMFKEINFNRDRTTYKGGKVQSKWSGNLSELVISKTGWKIPKGLYRIAQPVFDNLPTSYLESYKNPCWKVGKQLRCLPYFYLAGMAKSGSTDLWAKIASHPQVVKNKKEYHWWNLHRFKMRVSDKGFSQYLSRASHLLSISPRKISLIIGDGTPATLWDTFCLHEFMYNGTITADLPYLTPDIIHAIQPNAKFVVIVREPASTVQSAYQAFNKGPVSAEEFHLLVNRTVNYYNKCFRKHGVRVCVENKAQRENKSEPYAYMKQGFVAIHLHTWLRLYPREQFKLVELNDWHENCTGILPEIYNFLGVDPVKDGYIQSACHSPAQNARRREITMWPETRQMMETFYEPFNQMLYQLMDPPRVLWPN